MNKKLICIILSCLLFIALLSACADSTPEEEGSDADSRLVETVTESDTEDEDDTESDTSDESDTESGTPSGGADNGSNGGEDNGSDEGSDNGAEGQNGLKSEEGGSGLSASYDEFRPYS